MTHRHNIRLLVVIMASSLAANVDTCNEFLLWTFSAENLNIDQFLSIWSDSLVLSSISKISCVFFLAPEWLQTLIFLREYSTWKKKKKIFADRLFQFSSGTSYMFRVKSIFQFANWIRTTWAMYSLAVCPGFQFIYFTSVVSLTI